MSTWILAVATCALVGLAFLRSEDVSWKKDKCGALGVIVLMWASLWMLWSLGHGLKVAVEEAVLVVAFVIFLSCRALSKKRWPGGPFGKTDSAPLSTE